MAEDASEEDVPELPEADVPEFPDALFEELLSEDPLATVAFFAAAVLLVFVAAATVVALLEADRAGSSPEASWM